MVSSASGFEIEIFAPHVCSSNRHKSFSISDVFRFIASFGAPHTGDHAAAIKRFATRLAVTSLGPDASPFAHQSVHSPSCVGTDAPTAFSISITASVAVVSRTAGSNPNLFQAATNGASGGNG